MRQKKMASTIVMVFLLGVWVGLSVPQRSNSSDCKAPPPPDLSSCLEYLEKGAPKPSGACCSDLTRAVQTSDTRCLCHAVRGAASKSKNKDQALLLADACNIRSDALSPCEGFLYEAKYTQPAERIKQDDCAGCKTGRINDPGAPTPAPTKPRVDGKLPPRGN